MVKRGIWMKEFFVRRGQVSGFTILGLLLVVLVVLLFFLRGEIGLVLPGGLGGKSTDLREHVSTCLQEVVPDYLEWIGLRGGYLSPGEGTYRLMEGVPVSILCSNIEGEARCQNRMLTVGEMEEQLGKAIDDGLNTCVDYGLFRKRGYDLTVEQRTVSVDIGPDAVTVTVVQPVELTKGGVGVREEEFIEHFSVPLGRLYEVSQDIVTSEASVGGFDQLPYMLVHKGQYVIEKKKPYPDVLYILHMKDHPYTFQFFVEGEPTSA